MTQQWKQQVFHEAVSCKVSSRRGYCHAQVSANSVLSSAGHCPTTNPSPAEFLLQKLPGKRYIFCLGHSELIWRTLPASSLENEISTRAV